MSEECGPETNVIHTGDARETLAAMPESSVHMVMTSPPYYGLRDYSVDGQIGLEDSLDAYIQTLVDVGDAIRHVLRDDGSWWLNLGDSYAGSGQNNDTKTRAAVDGDGHTRGHIPADSFVQKDKMLVPHRVAIALQDAGWVVRNDVTWVKPNPMPQSVKDRLNTTTEQIFHLTPQPDYWYDLDAIREPLAEASKDRISQNDGNPVNNPNDVGNPGRMHNFNPDQLCHENGKNPGDVFEVTTKPYPDSHFAVYPPALCEKPIKASCPPKVCVACGTPYERVAVDEDTIPMPNTDRDQGRRALERFEQSDLSHQHLRAIQAVGFTDAGQAQEVYDGQGNNTKAVERLAEKAKDVLGGYVREFLGDDTGETEWVTGCDCDTDDTEPGVVLDPFIGAGTTAVVARDLGRQFIGVELNPEYADMARARIGMDVNDPCRIRDDDAQQGFEQY